MPEKGPIEFRVDSKMVIAPTASQFTDSEPLPLSLIPGDKLTVYLRPDLCSCIEYSTKSGSVLVAIPSEIMNQFDLHSIPVRKALEIAERIHLIEGLPYEAADCIFRMLEMPTRNLNL
jgi:hypothetical protein